MPTTGLLRRALSSFSHFINQISKILYKLMQGNVSVGHDTSQTLASILGLTNLVQGLHSLMSFCTAWPEIQNVCQKSRLVMTRPLPTVVGILNSREDMHINGRHRHRHRHFSSEPVCCSQGSFNHQTIHRQLEQPYCMQPRSAFGVI